MSEEEVAAIIRDWRLRTERAFEIALEEANAARRDALEALGLLDDEDEERS